jgi:hypothetical protein
VDRSAPSVGVRRLFLGLAVVFLALGGVYIAAGVVRLANPHYAGWFSLGNAYWYELALGAFFVLFGVFWLYWCRRYP